MKSWGRFATAVLVALLAGFVGGVWFMGTGLGFELIPAPKVATAIAPQSQPKRPPPKQPRVKAVSVPASPRSSVFGSGGLMPRAERLDLLPTPGCLWEIEPRPLRIPGSWHATNLERAFGGDATIDPAHGGLRFLLVQSTAHGVGPTQVRPVFFDENANRVMFDARPLSSSSNPRGTFTMEDFLVDPKHALPPAKIKYFGLERVVPQAALLASKAAQAEASQQRLSILPAPELGQTYHFDLPTIEGKRIRTEDFEGKYLVVAVWGPRLRLPNTFGLFLLKNQLKDVKPDEVAIVGVSFDGSVENARESFATIGRDGPLVVIPNDPTTRRIWAEGAQIAEVPTFYLVDRMGKPRIISKLSDITRSVDLLLGRTNTHKFARTSSARPRLVKPPARQSPSPGVK